MLEHCEITNFNMATDFPSRVQLPEFLVLLHKAIEDQREKEREREREGKKGGKAGDCEEGRERGEERTERRWREDERTGGDRVSGFTS